VDVSQEYIKMCEKAEEIQNGKQEWSSGDIWYTEEPNGTEFPQIHILGGSPEHGIHICPVCWQLREGTWNQGIWLPRQDQLQEMLYSPQPQGYGYDKLVSLKLLEWATEYNKHYDCVGYKEYPNSFKSMEQLWLAFVMRERFGKAWSGTKWDRVE